jgi:hypothetical protein
MSQKDHKDYWSECGQAFFHYGKGYGLTETLETICLSNEDDIKKFLETGELSNAFNAKQGLVLEAILDYRKEQGIGTADTRAADMERASDYGTSRRKSKAVRQLTIRERLPMRISRTKNKSLSRK